VRALLIENEILRGFLVFGWAFDVSMISFDDCVQHSEAGRAEGSTTHIVVATLFVHDSIGAGV
jgi:hypothetical protein